MLKKNLRRKISQKLAAKYGELCFDLAAPPSALPGDFAVNLPMVLANRLRSDPGTLARDIAAELSLINEIKKTSVVGGFVNLEVSDRYLFEMAGTSFLTTSSRAGSRTKKILIEFVSSNPTGPLHIGHGRCAAIGDSLARLFEYLGCDVEREYYVNDAGNQMKILASSVEARARELSGSASPAEFPETGYKGAYIYDIAREAVASGAKNFGAFARDCIMKDIAADLDIFRVKMDRYLSESSLYGKVASMLKDFAERGLAYENDGALWFAAGLSASTADDKKEERVLRKRTGELTYFASDIAYHADKYARGYDEMIDVWGADHHGYVPRVRNSLKALGLDESKIRIILYQLVSLKRAGKKVAMSTRAGEFVTLREIVAEVGADAARFFLLARAPGSAIEFDVDLAKKRSSENPVFYVQYAHARISSVFDEAARRGFAPENSCSDLSGLTGDAAERDLAKSVATLDDTFELCAREYTTHHITTHLLEIARRLHNFYEKCRVLSDDKKLTFARLGLLDSARRSIKQGLSILGVESPDKM
ncbi:MAG: arginine--tRNA ligase [Endomicrobiia bacterium]|nr:arginine--tRNA ligase [Endomicrobiia bacterium]